MSTLQAIDKSYVNAELKERHGDIVYRCEIEGKVGYIPIIFMIEHQSTAHENMAFRLLQYTLHLMHDHLNAGYDRLPMVLPLCLYHGTPSPYPYSTDVYDCFDDPDLARQFVFKPFQLIDLTTKSIESFRNSGLASMMEILLKAYQRSRLCSSF